MHDQQESGVVYEMEMREEWAMIHAKTMRNDAPPTFLATDQRNQASNPPHRIANKHVNLPSRSSVLIVT